MMLDSCTNTGGTFSPDRSEKPLQKNTQFCRRKKATKGSSFYLLQNGCFLKSLKQIAGLAIEKLFKRWNSSDISTCN
jgi:hypothetical protein